MRVTCLRDDDNSPANFLASNIPPPCCARIVLAVLRSQNARLADTPQIPFGLSMTRSSHL